MIFTSVQKITETMTPFMFLSMEAADSEATLPTIPTAIDQEKEDSRNGYSVDCQLVPGIR